MIATITDSELIEVLLFFFLVILFILHFFLSTFDRILDEIRAPLNVFECSNIMLGDIHNLLVIFHFIGAVLEAGLVVLVLHQLECPLRQLKTFQPAELEARRPEDNDHDLKIFAFPVGTETGAGRRSDPRFYSLTLFLVEKKVCIHVLLDPGDS